MSVRDEMAKTMYEAFGGDIARVNFEHAADALMPIVERVAREVREKIVADIRDRRGLRQAWDDIDEDVQQEIESTHDAIVAGVIGRE